MFFLLAFIDSRGTQPNGGRQFINNLKENDIVAVLGDCQESFAFADDVDWKQSAGLERFEFGVVYLAYITGTPSLSGVLLWSKCDSLQVLCLAQGCF